MDARTFFVSYTQTDRGWAEWIAWTLEAAGHKVVLQAWDFHGGGNFVRDMEQAAASADHTVAVLSAAYLASAFGFAEWAAAFVRDPKGKERPLIPVRVEDVQPPMLLRQITYIDLVGLERTLARETLLTQVLGERRAPAQEPTFPGAPPPEPKAPKSSIARLDFIDPPLEGTGDELFSVAFSPCGRWIAAGSNQKVLLWDRSQPQAPLAINGPGSYVYSVAFSSDGKLLACGCEDHVVRLWDVEARRWLWHAPGEEPTQTHDDAVYSVAFSPDDAEIVSGGYDRRIYCWDTASGRSAPEQPKTLDDVGRITAVAYCPTSADFIAIGSLDNKVRVWNRDSNGVQLLEGHQSSVETLAFSPDGHLLASAGLDKTVRLWDWRAGQQLWCGALHEYLVRAVAFSPDGKTLASVSWDKTLRLWDSGRHDVAVQIGMLPLRNLGKPWHSDWIWSVAFAPDGKTLATSGSDGQVLLWQLPAARSGGVSAASPGAARRRA